MEERQGNIRTHCSNSQAHNAHHAWRRSKMRRGSTLAILALLLLLGMQGSSPLNRGEVQLQ